VYDRLKNLKLLDVTGVSEYWNIVGQDRLTINFQYSIIPPLQYSRNMTKLKKKYNYE